MPPSISDGDPFRYPFGNLNHYYGDGVRTLFVVIAVMVGIAIPFSGDLRTGALIGAPVIVALLVLAGLTSPHGKIVLVLNLIAAAVGVVLSQVIALSAYAQEYYPFFAFMEAISILLMAALYFSVKTARAMAAHKIGKADGVGEFDEDN